MGELQDLIAMRRLLRAAELFMKSAKKVTNRDPFIDTDIEASRYEQSKNEFRISKQMLLEAIDNIDPNSELARNMEKIFNISKFEQMFHAELDGFKREVQVSSDNSDAIELSTLSGENEIFEFELEVLRRLHFSPRYVAKLEREVVNNG